MTSPLAPDDLDAQRLRSPGSTMLADLLQFAAEGGIASSASREGSPDPLLVDLADRLWRMGLEVAADYGPEGGVRIPLAVGHPTLPGTYGIAVLTDTAAYVAEPNLRMRDRYWLERLERRGWDVLVLSSLDVFLDPEAAAEAVLDAVSSRVRALPQSGAAALTPPVVVDDDAENPPVSRRSCRWTARTSGRESAPTSSAVCRWVPTRLVSCSSSPAGSAPTASFVTCRDSQRTSRVSSGCPRARPGPRRSSPRWPSEC